MELAGWLAGWLAGRQADRRPAGSQLASKQASEQASKQVPSKQGASEQTSKQAGEHASDCYRTTLKDSILLARSDGAIRLGRFCFRIDWSFLMLCRDLLPCTKL